jgi:hypothetical protein
VCSNEVKELAEWRRFTRAFGPRRALEVRGPQGALAIRHGIEDEQELRNLIIRGAGLTETTRKWWGTLYTRPRG